jgi:hypothetical protein
MYQRAVCLLPFAAFCTSLLVASADAELVVLEKVAGEVKDELKTAIGDAKVVVSVRQIGKTSLSWPVHEGLSTELTAALRSVGVDAISAAMDVRIENLSDPKVEHAGADAKRIKATDRDTFVSGSLPTNGAATLKLIVWKMDSTGMTWTPSWTKTIDLPKVALDLTANIPEMNRKVVEFCRSNFDKKVGDGVCAQLATLSLEAAKAKRIGIYTWGRELDDREPLLPGDCLQMELVEMKAPGFTRRFHHHTAVVEEVRPDAIVVLQQNVKPKGQIVQRDTWPKAAFKGGNAIAYRPTDGSTSLPPMLPRRRSPATPVKRGNSIDVLKTVNPKLDSVKGIWFIEENSFRSNRDDFARLQIPIDPPEQYTLRLKVTRLFGSDQFAVGLIVGGRQVMCSFDAYGGTASGLHLVDGKSVKSNATTRKGSVLPVDKPVAIRIQVTSQSVVAEVDAKPVVDWKGDASKLGQDPKYAVPRTDWLYFASWNTQFAISECFLDDDTPAH